MHERVHTQKKKHKRKIKITFWGKLSIEIRGT